MRLVHTELRLVHTERVLTPPFDSAGGCKCKGRPHTPTHPHPRTP